MGGKLSVVRVAALLHTAEGRLEVIPRAGGRRHCRNVEWQMDCAEDHDYTRDSRLVLPEPYAIDMWVLVIRTFVNNEVN